MLRIRLFMVSMKSVISLLKYLILFLQILIMLDIKKILIKKLKKIMV